jgi:hypothetical protein
MPSKIEVDRRGIGVRVLCHCEDRRKLAQRIIILFCKEEPVTVNREDIAFLNSETSISKIGMKVRIAVRVNVLRGKNERTQLNLSVEAVAGYVYFTRLAA